MMNQAAHPEAEASASTFDHSLWRWPTHGMRVRLPYLVRGEVSPHRVCGAAQSGRTFPFPKASKRC